MAKFYRVKKDTFLWHKGAILTNVFDDEEYEGYKPINDLWDASEHNDGEYITAKIIENNPEWFERVYEASTFKKLSYVTKEKARQVAGKVFNGKGTDETDQTE